MIERMHAAIGQPVIIENISGASGSIGVGRVARAAPDGYTLIIGTWSTHVVNGVVYALPYDVLNDFEPISLLTNNSQFVVAANATPATDLKSFIAWLRANPGKAWAGTAGLGSAQHVFGIFFQNITKTSFGFVDYRDGGQAMRDLVAGRIDIMITDQVTALPALRAGNIKGYAFTGRDRLRAAPDVPTTDEAGLPEFHTSVWVGMWAPKGTAKYIIAKLNASVVNALAGATERRLLANLGQQVVSGEQQTPQALGAFHKAETEKWWPVIKAAGIRVN
jgi:tripartite-type tricarboxylate transporter receptor subunit TctC